MLSKDKFFSITPASQKESRNTILILLAILFIGLTEVYFAPLKYFFNNIIGIESVNGCPLLTLAGVPCPLCGTGRILKGLAHFNISQAFYYNPLGIFFLIVSGITFIILFILSLTKRKLVLGKTAQKLWYIPALFIILMWILNILYGHHH